MKRRRRSWRLSVIVYRNAFHKNTNRILSAEREFMQGKRMKREYLNVLEKAGKAKELYEKLIVDFEDYGCLNYRDP